MYTKLRVLTDNRWLNNLNYKRNICRLVCAAYSVNIKFCRENICRYELGRLWSLNIYVTVVYCSIVYSLILFLSYK